MPLTPPALLEALLFAEGGALEKKRLSKLLGISPELLQKAVEALQHSLFGRGIALVETEEALELRTAPSAHDFVKVLREAELSRDLGRAGLETLAIVLYRGVATRGEVDFIRGVNSSATMRSLLLRGLIERTEDPTDKRKIQYKPTVEALAHLGLEKREQLPRFEELHSLLEERTVNETEA